MGCRGMKPKREEWVERILTGLSAVAGMLAVIGALYGGVVLVVIASEAPEALATVIAAGIIGAALCLRKPPKVFNLQMPHPDAEELLRDVRRLLKNRGQL